MADVNRGRRPLSPHLQVYNQSYTGTLSILHRVTGVALTLGAVLVIWWLVAAATGPAYFAFVDGLLTSLLGELILIGSALALSYHFANGIRHLVWDMGYGFELETVKKSGTAVIGFAVVLTLLIVVLA